MKRFKILAAVLALAFWVTGCSGNTTQTEGISPMDDQAEPTAGYQSLDYAYAAEDMDDSWDATTATHIELKGQSINVAGDGAKAENNRVTISQEGTYVVTGTLDDGQIVIDADSDALVRLVLNNAALHCDDSAPIYAKKAGKTVLILAGGSVNYVSDGVEYSYKDGEDEPDAAIFAKDALSINGNGALIVSGNFNNGIGTKDRLVITGGSIDVTAVNDGLRGRDAVAILSGDFTINAQNDGIKSNNDTGEDKGYIVLDGGTFQITAGNDGVQAETNLAVNGGSYDIVTGGGSANAPVQENTFRGPGGGQSSSTADSESMKALKASALIKVTGGTFDIDAEDDAVHANGDISITGGTFEISTGDDGFHADNALVIEDGNIRISSCYEGLEGATVDITGGTIYIKSSDDGINAAGGSDSGMDGPRGRDQFGANDNNYIRITGGGIEIIAAGDGIDSNGNLYIDGGAVYISGPTSGADSALDSDGVQQINGGVVIAASGRGMFEPPSDDSGQLSLVVYFDETRQADTKISLTDGDGALIAEYTPVNGYQVVVISAPELVLESTYNLYADDTLLTEITLTDIVTTIASDGSAVTGRIGGGMSGGGRPGENLGSDEESAPNRGGRENPGPMEGGMEERGPMGGGNREREPGGMDDGDGQRERQQPPGGGQSPPDRGEAEQSEDI